MANAKAPQSNTEYVAVRNDDARVYTFSYLDEREQAAPQPGVFIREKRIESVRLAPGMNFVEKAKLDRCLTADDCADGRVAGYDALSIVNVDLLPVGQAKALIANTGSKSQLKRWASIEKREVVLSALREKLA